MEFIGVAIYTYAKEACYICGKNENLVDTGTFIEGEGELAICDTCIKDAARTVGLGPMIDQTHKLAAAEEALENALGDLRKLSEQHAILVERFAGLQAEWVAAVEARDAAKAEPEPAPKPKAKPKPRAKATT